MDFNSLIKLKRERFEQLEREIADPALFSNRQRASEIMREHANIKQLLAKWSELEAVRKQLGPRLIAATGVMTNYGRMLINGKEQDVSVIGSDEQYPLVRNMVLLSGHFMDENDVQQRHKVAMLTEKLAQKLYGSTSAAVGQVGAAASPEVGKTTQALMSQTPMA